MRYSCLCGGVMNMGKIDYIHTVQPGTGGIDDAFLNRYVLMSGLQRERSKESTLAWSSRKQELKAIPYCLWNNRGQGEMTVWIHSSGSELS